jgi:hypothetical protein
MAWWEVSRKRGLLDFENWKWLGNFRTTKNHDHVERVQSTWEAQGWSSRVSERHIEGVWIFLARASRARGGGPRGMAAWSLAMSKGWPHVQCTWTSGPCPPRAWTCGHGVVQCVAFLHVLIKHGEATTCAHRDPCPKQDPHVAYQPRIPLGHAKQGVAWRSRCRKSMWLKIRLGPVEMDFLPLTNVFEIFRGQNFLCSIT